MFVQTIDKFMDRHKPIIINDIYWKFRAVISKIKKIAIKLFEKNKDQYRFKGIIIEKTNLIKLKYKPKISVIIPVYNTTPILLKKAINSVVRQFYKNWEICIVDDCSTNPQTISYLKRINNKKIIVNYQKNNKGIAFTSNEALKMSSGDFVAFLDHDDELTFDALYQVVKTINKTNADLIYSDEDKVTFNGQFLEPHFKPDYSPDMLLSQNYITHLAVYRKSLLKKINGLRESFEGSQDHDLLLRFVEITNNISHIPKVLYHWRKIPGSVAHSFNAKYYAWESGKKAINEALQRRNVEGEVRLGEFPGTYRVKRKLKSLPLISIIIPFKDQYKLLKNCIKSIIEKTTYKNFEIICINNNSQENKTYQLIKQLQQLSSQIKFYQLNIPFNYSKLNNFGVSVAKGEHIILLNNDTTIITPDWIEALLEHSQREEVGAVGAKLYYPNNKIQHAGIIIGIGGVAGHSHKYINKNSVGYFTRPHIIQNLSAVTAACLMIKKTLYQKMNGLDEDNLKIAFNDIDLCLRLREENYLNVFTPYCELYHYESSTRGPEDTPEKKLRFAAEIKYMKKRHKIIYDGDPYYNPSLSLEIEDFSIKIRS